MRLVCLTPFLLMSSLIAGGGALAQTANPPDGQPVTVDGVETVCTGTTTDERQDPRWRDYPFRLEFVGRNGHYLGDEVVTVTGGRRSVSVHCDGPWVLMRLPPGSYRVEADVAEAGRKVLTAGARSHVTVRFPDAGGEGSRGPRSQPLTDPNPEAAYPGRPYRDAPYRNAPYRAE